MNMFPKVAAAAENIDLSKMGSISVTMSDDGKKVSGGNLTIYKVAEIMEKSGNYSFVYAETWNGCTIEFEDIPSSKLAQELEKYAASKKLEGETKTINNDGAVRFENLQTGLYLLVQDKAAEGYNTVNPFLISLPTETDGNWNYDVDASPKVELEKETTKPTTPEEPTPDKPTTSTRLPQTGQLNWPIPVLAIAGLTLFTFGWYLCFGKKEKKYEK